MASTATPTPDRHPFQRKLDETKIPKSDINNLIMDYLITQGYPLAAERFAREAKIQPNFDLEIKNQSIGERVRIREAIHQGDLKTAIELINDFNPQLLDKDGALHFSLLRLQLIELIRKTPNCPDTSAIQEALQFATENLADRASTNPQWLHEFERAMCLFLFRREDWAKQIQFQQSNTTASNTAMSLSTTTRLNGSASNTAHSSNTTTTTVPQPPFGALSELIDPNLRRKVAKDVNEAILRSQDRSLEARLYDLVRTRAWAEKLAREGRKIDLPDRMPLGLDGDDRDEESSRVANGQAAHNGHVGAVTNGTDSRPTGGDLLMAEAGRGNGDTSADADAAPSSGPGRQDSRSVQETGGSSSRAEGDAALAQFTNI